ncbi:hypothetical protein HDU81_006655 [Chytriomyces hyalinus]|nr:hypothetical protein HDU81_006655 [Chytriomyces hyalinus]
MTTIIPRARLFGNPERTSAKVNWTASRVAFLAPHNNLLNVFVVSCDQGSVDIQNATCVTNDTARGIRMFGWTANPDVLFFMQDKGGDEDWKVYSVNVETGAEVCLTPAAKTNNTVAGVSRDYPDHLLISSNQRDPTAMDLHLVNIFTGESSLVLENDSKCVGFTVDHKFSSAIATKANPDSSIDFLLLKLAFSANFNKVAVKTRTEKVTSTSNADGISTTTIKTVTEKTVSKASLDVTKSSEGTHVLHMDAEDAGWGDCDPYGFSDDLSCIYMASYKGRNTSAFVSFNLETKETIVIGSDDRSDISGCLIDAVTHKPLAYQTNYEKKKYTAVDKDDASLQRDFSVLDAEAGEGGEWSVESKSQDGRVWIVSISKANFPNVFYFYSRETKVATYLFNTRPVLEEYALSSLRAVEVTTRDGLTMLAYLTIPHSKECQDSAYSTEPMPLILHVHGGPYGRDEFGFNRYHQLFANRGYAVLSPQFRGSTGFGKAFLNAATGEWAGKMHDDLIDAGNWAVEQGIAIKDKIAIHGGSYGGYSSLVGVTFTPEYFACSVSIVGPSNVSTLLDSIPAYWGPVRSMLTTRIGADTDTEEGRAFLLSRSPISRVDSICRPLLIGQGANDPRVKQAESDQIFDAMVEKNIPVTYVLYPDEGHGFARPPNNISFVAVTEAFLAKHLGGVCEEVGTAFEGASLEFKGGRTEIGL